MAFAKAKNAAAQSARQSAVKRRREEMERERELVMGGTDIPSSN